MADFPYKFGVQPSMAQATQALAANFRKAMNRDVFTTKGDLLVGTGAGQFDRLGVGADGQALVADSGSSAWVKWDGPAVGKVARLGALTHTAGSGAFMAVTFDTVGISLNVTAAASATPLTCTVAGNYVVSAQSAWTNTATGARIHRVIRYNASNVIQEYLCLSTRPGNAGHFSDASSSDITSMAVGDYLKLEVWQDTGGNLAMNQGSGSYLASIQMARVR